MSCLEGGLAGWILLLSSQLFLCFACVHLNALDIPL